MGVYLRMELVISLQSYALFGKSQIFSVRFQSFVQNFPLIVSKNDGSSEKNDWDAPLLVAALATTRILNGRCGDFVFEEVKAFSLRARVTRASGYFRFLTSLINLLFATF